MKAELRLNNNRIIRFEVVAIKRRDGLIGPPVHIKVFSSNIDSKPVSTEARSEWKTVYQHRTVLAHHHTATLRLVGTTEHIAYYKRVK